MGDVDNILQQISKEQLVVLAIGGVLFLISLVLAYHIRNLMRLVREENRFFSPGQAWVVALPLINIFYNFIIIRKLCDSLNNEFYDRREAVEENPTLRQGYFMAFGYLAANFPLPIFIAFLVYIISLVYYVNYILKILAYKKLLSQPPPLPADEVAGEDE
jgi:ABC-type antimicrobial peptide transport system permease subunit